MTKFVAAVFAVTMLNGASSVYASEAMKAIVASYLEIHAALAADTIDGVKPAARAIAEQSARLGSAGAEIAKTAKAVEAASDLKSAREALGPLTDAVIAAGKADGWQDVSGIRVGFCPMVRRSWIQKDGGVANPYYGKSMSTCGELKDLRK